MRGLVDDLRQVEPIPGAGHLVQLDQPLAVTDPEPVQQLPRSQARR
jgi:hypothetical protein